MTNFIQSASGWRKVFAKSGDENDTDPQISDADKKIIECSIAAFTKYLKLVIPSDEITIALGRDTRPTGVDICDTAIKTFIKLGVKVKYLGITCAPQIMCYACNVIGHEKVCDGFMYISASHNPIAHNGLKFGLSNGGVLDAAENKKVVELFNDYYNSDNLTAIYQDELETPIMTQKLLNDTMTAIYDAAPYLNMQSLTFYKNFFMARTTALVLSSDSDIQKKFSNLCNTIKNSNIAIAADFNGSARCLSIDTNLFKSFKIPFYAINNTAGIIPHGIIPEGRNLQFLSDEITRQQNAGNKNLILGYTCDCDGDRGNIVLWDDKKQVATILFAQEVFALCTLAAISYHLGSGTPANKICVVCNCATSMRVDDIAKTFGVKVARCEVGEANVVNTARALSSDGYVICISGEGSNGGVIIPPNFVRDPLDTVFLILKLLCDKTLFERWCKMSGVLFSQNYTLSDILQTLPKYTTTATTDKRAVLHIRSNDCTILQRRFQNLFLNEWGAKKAELFQKYGILSYKVHITRGIKELTDEKDFSLAGSGGLKIIFFDEGASPIAFLWMRKSGTEPIFRIMCDVKGCDKKSATMEGELLSWFSSMIKIADE